MKIDLDKRGEVVGAHLEKNTESHQMIEEFMLAANEATAEFLTEKETAFLRAFIRFLTRANCGH